MSWPILKYRAAKIEARRDLSPRELRSEDEKDLRFWTNFGIAVAILIGFAVIIIHRGVITTGIAAYGAALGTGGVLGFLFGVPGSPKAPVNIKSTGPVAINTGNNSKVAGGNLDPAAANAQQPAAAPPPALINNAAPNPPASPDTPSAGTSPDDPPSAPQSTPVSNLEQVADWVTKLLLGGGLTQMQRIPPKIWQWAHIVALGIIGSKTTLTDQLILAQQAFAAGLLVYGFILGFFAGFLITKLQLGKAIV
jgi:hypothetical protein